MIAAATTSGCACAAGEFADDAGGPVELDDVDGDATGASGICAAGAGG